MNKIINLLKQQTDFISEITEEDFNIIWQKIKTLSIEEKKSKAHLQKIIGVYYKQKYKKDPLFKINDGLDFGVSLLVLKKIEEELNKK